MFRWILVLLNKHYFHKCLTTVNRHYLFILVELFYTTGPHITHLLVVGHSTNPNKEENDITKAVWKVDSSTGVCNDYDFTILLSISTTLLSI